MKRITYKFLDSIYQIKEIKCEHNYICCRIKLFSLITNKSKTLISILNTRKPMLYSTCNYYVSFTGYHIMTVTSLTKI